MKHSTIRLFLLVWLFSFALAQSYPVQAANQVVTDCGDTGGANQLRAKITAAQSSGGGTITFSCGPNVTLTMGVLPTITSNITIDGGSSITLSGNNASRVFVVNSGATLTLNNITITKATVSGDGGAIYAAGTLNVNNSRFVDNQTVGTYSGGAIRADGVLNITSSEFSNNKATNGGALYVKWPAALATITASTFSNNQTLDLSSGWGGAMLVFDGATAILKHSTVTGNQAGIGGGLYSYYGTLILTSGSTLSGNWTLYGGDGGALYNRSGTLTAIDVTLSSNLAIYNGGSISNDAGNATLTNVTLSGSHAEVSGGGIYNSGTLTLTNVTLSGNDASGIGALHNAGTATLTNVTLSGNSTLPPDFGGVVGGIGNAGSLTMKNTLIAKGQYGKNCESALGGSYNLSDDDSCGFGGSGVNLNLGPLANNGGPTLTHMPRTPSPAINGGTGAGCPQTDQRGGSRPQGTACDVGAVEVGAKVPWLWLPLIRR